MFFVFPRVSKNRKHILSQFVSLFHFQKSKIVGSFFCQMKCGIIIGVLWNNERVKSRFKNSI